MTIDYRALVGFAGFIGLVALVTQSAVVGIALAIAAGIAMELMMTFRNTGRRA
jgi:hypothetical protein